jgi:hypothetical protein
MCCCCLALPLASPPTCVWRWRTLQQAQGQPL